MNPYRINVSEKLTGQPRALAGDWLLPSLERARTWLMRLRGSEVSWMWPMSSTFHGVRMPPSLEKELTRHLVFAAGTIVTSLQQELTRHLVFATGTVVTLHVRGRR